ncbi:intein C-terminal splicing region/intein N-terminal splicing region/RHS repeat-associated core domain-containing protein [Thermoactinomyces sp. DSM 45891]|nr:intein C-terminal splicing region/intein N-terminal splicing region/RHS repeat-associated core domain-containing protein [Thermoactinomyces sp. DSM 45891]
MITGGQVISEEVDDIIARSYTYSPWGERLSMTKKVAQGSETSYYLNNTDVDVEMLLDEQGDVRATYGYTPYGENDDALFSGVDKPDPKNPNKEMYNAYRYSGKPWDPNTKSYDLGFRNYFPEVGRYLTADSYTDSEKYRGLLMDTANYNVYGFTDGNPVSNHDPDGHAGEFFLPYDLTYLLPSKKHLIDKPLGAPYDPSARRVAGRWIGGKPKPKPKPNPSPSNRNKNAYKHWKQTLYSGKYRGKFGAERAYVEEMRSSLTLEEKYAAQNIFDGVLFGIGLFLAPEYEASSGFRFWLSTTRVGRSAGKYIDKATASIAGFFTGKSSTPTPKPISCFTAGTLIATSVGEKPIEEIQIGDKVLAKDEKTGNLDYKKVVHLFEREVDEIYEVYVSDQKIETTAEHPFWVEGKGWTKVKDLREGDNLFTSKRKRLPIDKIVVKKKHTTVYNITVEGYHTYFVTDLNIFVHNKLPLNLQAFGKYKTTSEATKAAKELSYVKTNFQSHGQPVFKHKKKNLYITPDVDSHNGGAWKMADSVRNLGSKKTRMGTFDEDLNKIGD